MLQAAAARLVATEWAPNLNWAEGLAGLGTILGLALGASRFRGGIVTFLAALYTSTIVPWQLTTSAPDDLLIDRLNRVSWILWISVNQFLNRLPVRDTLFFVSLVSLAFWLIGIVAGYALARHGKVLGSIAMAGSALLIVQAYGNYQPRGSWWLALFILLGLLLVGRVHFLTAKHAWSERKLFVNEEAGTNILTGLFMTAALAILVAWWLPSSPGSVQRATDLWNAYVEPLRERLSNAVTSLEGPYGRPGRNFYASSLALGQNAASGDAEVLTVTVLESPGINTRYYWRGRSYNVYDGGLWSVSTNARLLKHPDQGDLEIPNREQRAEGLFQISSEFEVQSLMYVPASTVWIDRSADVAAMRVGPSLYDPYSWEARTAVTAGGTYQARALLRNPTVLELQSAGEDYPGWISGQYLAVPEAYREALAALAAEVTAEATTTYDKTSAITNYLRETIEYSASVPAAPEGEDPVMWVLLDYKKGFCNYYASAEVLLLRSVGIPARLAVGFARGDLENGIYTVFRRDAHAWPEVYFPNIGWVEFEPTTSQPALVRPTGETAEGSTDSDDDARTRQEEELSREPEDIEMAPPATPVPFLLTPAGRVLSTGLPILVAFGLLVIGIRFRVPQRIPTYLVRIFETGGGSAPDWIRIWESWNALEPVQRAFSVVRWTLWLLGKRPPFNATPGVQAAALIKALPSAKLHIEALREELETGLFTRRQPDLRRARIAALAVLFRGLGVRLNKIVAALDGRAVYSE